MQIEKTNTRLVGHLGDYVYYYVKKEFRKRIFFIPVQPGSPEQLLVWEKFRQGVLAWQSLSEAEKENWNKKAYRYRFEGFNLFMRKKLKE